jgi:hypothetical protein
MQITNNPTPLEQFNSFLNALHSETDRGAALAAAAFAEELLDLILRAFLANLPETDELIAGFSAPLGTFAAKTKLSYVLGLLDAELFRSLTIVRKVRNRFAHQWTPATFTEDAINDLVNAIPVHPVQMRLKQPISAREIFDSRVSAVLMELALLPDLVKEHQREPSRLIRFGQFHDSREAAVAEWKEHQKTGKLKGDA